MARLLAAPCVADPEAPVITTNDGMQLPDGHRWVFSSETVDCGAGFETFQSWDCPCGAYATKEPWRLRRPSKWFTPRAWVAVARPTTAPAPTPVPQP